MLCLDFSAIRQLLYRFVLPDIRMNCFNSLRHTYFHTFHSSPSLASNRLVSSASALSCSGFWSGRAPGLRTAELMFDHHEGILSLDLDVNLDNLELILQLPLW